MLNRQAIEAFTKQAEAFSQQVFSSTSGFALTLLGAYASIWILYVGYNAVVKGDFNLAEVINKVMRFSILAAMLMANSKLSQGYVFAPIKDTTNALVKNVLSISPTINGKKLNSVNEAMDSLEWTYGEFFKFAGSVFKKGGFSVFMNSISVLFLVHFFLAMGEAIYTFHVLANSLKLCAVFALSPLLIVAFAFNNTRGYVIGALQYVLCSSLTLIISSFHVGLILFYLRSMHNQMNVETVSANDVVMMLHVLLGVSIMANFILLLANGLAAAISGARSDTALTGLAASAVAGGSTFIASKLGLGALKGFGSVSKMVGQSPRTSAASSNANVNRNNFSRNYAPGRNP